MATRPTAGFYQGARLRRESPPPAVSRRILAASRRVLHRSDAEVPLPPGSLRYEQHWPLSPHGAMMAPSSGWHSRADVRSKPARPRRSCLDLAPQCGMSRCIVRGLPRLQRQPATPKMPALDATAATDLDQPRRQVATLFTIATAARPTRTGGHFMPSSGYPFARHGVARTGSAPPASAIRLARSQASRTSARDLCVPASHNP